MNARPEQITRWVPIVGRWDLSTPGRALYLGPTPRQPTPYGICVSRARLVALFFSYSHRDEGLRDQLETHLAMLKRHGFIETWHDRRIKG